MVEVARIELASKIDQTRIRLQAWFTQIRRQRENERAFLKSLFS